MKKKHELEIRIAFFSLKGEFPAKVTVDQLMGLESHARDSDIPFPSFVRREIAFNALLNCLSPDNSAQNSVQVASPHSSFNSSDVVTTTLSTGLGNKLKDGLRAREGSKALILKYELARKSGDEIRIDVDAWARDYKENEHLYKTVVSHFPLAIRDAFDHVWTKRRTQNESVYHIEHCANRIRNEQPSLENLERLDEAQQELVRTAVQDYCREHEFLANEITGSEQ